MSINAMHAKPGLRVVLKWMIAGSGSVIADVIRLFPFATGPNAQSRRNTKGNRRS